MANNFLLCNLPPQIRVATVKGRLRFRTADYIKCCQTGQTPPPLWVVVFVFVFQLLHNGPLISATTWPVWPGVTHDAKAQAETCLTSLSESPPLAWSRQRSIPSSCPSRRCLRPTARGRAGRRRHGGGSGSWPFPNSMTGNGMEQGWEVKETWRLLFFPILLIYKVNALPSTAVCRLRCSAGTSQSEPRESVCWWKERSCATGNKWTCTGFH